MKDDPLEAAIDIVREGRRLGLRFSEIVAAYRESAAKEPPEAAAAMTMVFDEAVKRVSSLEAA